MNQFELGHYDAANFTDEGYGPSRQSQPNVSGAERMLSIAAGIGLAAIGLAKVRISGLVLGALGAGLVWRGYSGRCQCYSALGIDTTGHNDAIGVPAQKGYRIEKTIVVDRPPAELYEFWQRLENLPKVMSHLKQVERIDNNRSHWVAEGVLGKDVEWEAEIINDRENELIAWRSVPGGDVDTAGSIHFRSRGNNAGTEVTLSMKYNPPAGKLGAQVAALFGEDLDEKLHEDLRRFKQVMETGMEPAPAVSGSSANK